MLRHRGFFHGAVLVNKSSTLITLSAQLPGGQHAPSQANVTQITQRKLPKVPPLALEATSGCP